MIIEISKLPCPRLLRLNAVGFNGEVGGEGRARDEPLELDTAAFEESRELNSSDGENNFEEELELACAAKELKNGDIIDDIVVLVVDDEFINPNGDLKSPKFSRFISDLIKSWSSG